MSNATRQLTVIMFTDVVGFTALMGSDEHKAMSLLKTNREIHKRIIKKHQGKWLKEMGDGTLASFHAVTDAVYCAGALINACNEKGIDLRIGIHSGDVIEEDGDIFGDGVNVASRLEPLASPNQIMVSAPIHRNIKNKSGITSTFIEEKQLKNVDEPVRIYSVEVTESGEVQRSYSTTKRPNPFLTKQMLIGVIAVLIVILAISMFFNPLGEGESTSDSIENYDIKKSIAVLPFKDMSPDQDQEYLGDGIAEDIINKLTKISDLKIIGRTSSFSFKTKETDLKTIGEMLGVETILEGSVQKSGNQLRITAQLINAVDGFHIWSEQFNREFSDVFSIQDELAQLVVSKMLDVSASENKISNINESAEPEAYEYFLKGKYISESIFQMSFEIKDFKLAENMFRKAIKLDPNFALPHAGLADLYNTYQKAYAYEDSNLEKQKYIDNQIEEIEIAYGLNPQNDYISRVMGWIYYNIEKFDAAYENFENSVQLNPNDSWNLLALSHFLTNDGLYEEALVAINRSIDIDPIFIAAYNIRGIINMHLGKYDLALKDFQKTIEIDSENLNSYYWSSVLYELMHDKHNSQKMWEILKFLNPEVESKLPIKINIFLSNKGKEAFDEYYIINALLESKYQDAIELLKKNKKLLFNYQMLNKMPLFNPIRDEKIFIELVENKKSEYITLKTKYGNLDFLDL